MNFDNIFETVSYWVFCSSMKLRVALLVFFAGNSLHRLISRLVAKDRIKSTLFHFLDNLPCYILLLLVLVAATNHLGINTIFRQFVISAAVLFAAFTVKIPVQHQADFAVSLALGAPGKDPGYRSAS